MDNYSIAKTKDLAPEKEAWSKPEVDITSVNEETLGLGVDAEKVIHFLSSS
ncbi:hypothetical protein [uncultured Mucilaginibacter sp.]|uniref:hypothetical protein n=1 Tax=uncultured Mucilaginibacter sp. TaxID=797541 RepID=UPI0025F80A5A|nr:hypothetical protein [uncultured Mucilaginibacter sp.]